MSLHLTLLGGGANLANVVWSIAKQHTYILNSSNGEKQHYSKVDFVTRALCVVCSFPF